MNRHEATSTDNGRDSAADSAEWQMLSVDGGFMVGTVDGWFNHPR